MIQPEMDSKHSWKRFQSIELSIVNCMLIVAALIPLVYKLHKLESSMISNGQL